MFLDIFRCLHKVLLTWSLEKTCDYGGTFRTHSNIYDGVFWLVKGFQQSAFFSKKSFMADFPLGSRQASGLCRNLRKIGDTELFLFNLRAYCKTSVITSAQSKSTCMKCKKCRNAVNINKKGEPGAR